MIDALIGRLGADPRDVRVLAKTLQQDKAYRLEQQMTSGIDLRSLKLLLVIPLSLAGIGLLVMTWFYREQPANVAFLILTAQMTAFGGTMAYNILMDLISDDDYRVIASWPFRANSFLLARMLPIMRNALILAAFIGGPSVVLACFTVGTPLLTGLSLGLVLVVFTISMVLLISAVASLAIRLWGIDTVRLLVVCMMVGGFLLYIMLSTPGSGPNPQLGLDFYALPAWLPSLWPSALVILTAGESNSVIWSYAGLGFLVLLPLPMLAFRHASRNYTRGLPAVRRSSAKAGGAWMGFLLGTRSRNHADRIIAQLSLAHARGDWRFRMQALLLPGLFLFIGLTMSKSTVGPDSFHIFGNPFVDRGWFHPAMIWMVLIMVPPIFALPMISQSSNYEAAWLLRMGRLDERTYRLSVRRLFRRIFLYPYILLLGACYLWYGMPIHHLAAHLLVLSLLGELMVGQMQVAFSNYPFSLPPKDEDLALKLVPVMLMLEIFGGLAAWAIYMTGYRWWWAYALLVLVIEGMRRASLTWGLKNAEVEALVAETPDGEAILEREETQQVATTPLMVAVREGRYHTAKTLLAGGADPLVVAATGYSALQLAEQGGDARMIDLLRNAAAQHDPESSG